jgi:thiosulfate dehydrogenase
MADKMAKPGSFGKRFGKILLGFVLFVVAILVYSRYGAPVAVADRPFPLEFLIVHIPLTLRIGGEMEQAPFGANQEVLESGAHIYHERCAICHGAPGQPSSFAEQLYPSPPQLWSKEGNVSEDEVGRTYWKVANGIRLTGMPTYQHVLTSTQMWQVSLLLKNADQPLPDPVQKILATPQPRP